MAFSTSLRAAGGFERPEETCKDLYPEIYVFENPNTAYRETRRGKPSRVEVVAFEFGMERAVNELQCQGANGGGILRKRQVVNVKMPDDRAL